MTQAPSSNTAIRLGVGLALLATIIVPFNDAIAKHLSASYPILQIVWARYAFHFLPVLALAAATQGISGLRPRKLPLHLFRGGLLVASTFMFFSALKTMPLTDALALVFVSPLVVTALSPFLVGEHVGIKRWSAVLVGFIGTLVIIRPGFADISIGAIFSLSAGTTFGIYLLVTRMLAGTAPPQVTLVYSALPGAVIMSAIVPFVWQSIDLMDWALMIGLGLFSAVAHYLLIRAYSMAPAPVLAPLGFFEIVSNAILGLVIFGDFPDLVTWIGIMIIIGSGVYISLRETKNPDKSPRNGADSLPG